MKESRAELTMVMMLDLKALIHSSKNMSENPDSHSGEDNGDEDKAEFINQ
jgi:hypothetical protein